MKTSRIIPILVTAIAGLFLSACGGAIVTSNWPGLYTDGTTAYLANGLQVYAVNVKDGTIQWKYPEKADTKRTFYASPVTTSDGQLLVAGFDGALYSLNPTNGQENWSNTDASDKLVGQPTVNDQTIYVPSADSVLYSLDLNGNENWSFTTGHALWGSPVVNGDDVVFGSMDHFIYAVNNTSGEKVWATDLGASIVGSPALGEDGTIYIGTVNNEIIALQGDTGSILWRVATDGGIWSKPAFKDGVLYFGDLTGNVYAMNAADGSVVWKKQPDAAIVGSPVITDSSIIFGTESGSLIAFDYNGSILWTKTVEGKLYTSPVLAGDLILVALTDGTSDVTMVAFDLNGTQSWTYTPEE